MKNKLFSILITSVCAVALVAAAVAFGVHLGGQISTGGGKEQETARTVTAAEPATSIVEPVGSIAIPGYDTITMKARQAVQEVSFYNPQRNTCYFVISLCLPEGTELFRSGLIAPGNTITSIELAQTLEAGIYEGTILRYSCFSLDDMQELNGSDVIFTLEVTP